MTLVSHMASVAPSARSEHLRFKKLLQVRPAIFGGLFVLLVTFGGFGTWAALAPIDSGVIASGVVTVATNRKPAQHAEGGIVSALLVRDGDKVDAGQPLVRLDDTRAHASLAILRSRLHSAQAIRARLTAEQTGATEISFPNTLLDQMPERNIADMMEGQRVLFQARRESLNGEITILRQRIDQLTGKIDAIEAQKRSKDQQLTLINEELEGLRELYAKGHTERSRILALSRTAARLEGERGEHSADIVRVEEAMSETRLQMLQTHKTFREEVVVELRDIQMQIFDLDERIGAARDFKERLEIRAPVAGTVVGIAVRGIGQVIKPGETILEIVPAGDPLVVEAHVRPVDIDNVSIGQDVSVRLTAFKQRATPALNGYVIYVSADTLIDRQAARPYYLARIEVPDSEVERLGDRDLLPGMPAETLIRTGERTALRYLLQPIVDSMGRAWREE
ncbi:MAG: HlyD family type I secretion periplasmic adaptor subunit [Minwuiales bacterium]|nr:HlyD family type I secretion periplasmic adaptor subunit [Minwuiales bacterium]